MFSSCLLSWLTFAIAADWSKTLWLARSQRHARLYGGCAAAAAGVCGIALCAGSSPGARRMKYLVLLGVLALAYAPVAQSEAQPNGPHTQSKSPASSRPAGAWWPHAHCGVHLPRDEASPSMRPLLLREHQQRDAR